VAALDFSAAYTRTNPTGGQGEYNDTSGSASTAVATIGSVPTAIVATGQGSADAEAASTLAYGESLPILLTAPTSLSKQASTAISSLGVKQVILMGGQLAISNDVVAALKSQKVSVLRIAGKDFTDTSVELAKFETASPPAGLGWVGTGDITIARGDFYTDGLAGAVVAADGPMTSAREPLLLTLSPSRVGASLTNFLISAGTSGIGGKRVVHLTILGGPDALTPTSVQAMETDL